MKSSASPSGGPYWMLVSSLPHLPHFERATQLPIGPQALAARLQMLDTVDQGRLQRTTDLLAWSLPASPPGATELPARIEAWLRQEPDAAVRQLVQHHLWRLALLSALRLKQAQAPAPAARLLDLLGPWAPNVRHHWTDPLFGLGARLPWLAQVRQHLIEGRALALQQAIDRALWTEADGLRRDQRVSGSAVLAYALQWRVLKRWLEHDPAVATSRLRQLAQAALRRHPTTEVQT